MWSLTLKTPPNGEPVLPADVILEGRLSSVEATQQAAKILRNIQTARLACEQYTGRQLLTATLTLKMDRWREEGLYFRGRVHQMPPVESTAAICFPELLPGVGGFDSIVIPVAPLLAVNSVKYLDGAGAQQVWPQASYIVSKPAGPTCGPGRISLASGRSWPQTFPVADAIEVEFDAGYGTTADKVPAPLVDGIVARALEMYDLRGNAASDARVAVASFPTTSELLWWPYRIGLGA